MNQAWDNMVCSAMQIAPEDIANQLSLLDLPCFKSIRPEELTSCGWMKANKLIEAPNVVAFTKRFNRVIAIFYYIITYFEVFFPCAYPAYF